MKDQADLHQFMFTNLEKQTLMRSILQAFQRNGSEDQIVKVNNWSKKLLGISVNTGLSNEAARIEI